MYSKRNEKLIKSLHSTKFRQKYKKFIAEGYKIVSEVISNHLERVEMIIVSKTWMAENICNVSRTD